MVAVDAHGARLIAGHELVNELGYGGLILLMGKLASGDRHAHDFLGRPPENVLGLRRPPHEAEIAIPFQYREGCIVDVR